MNSVINSLKRLERVGSENSRCTEKLRESVREIADLICDQIESPAWQSPRMDLPRHYQVTHRGTLIDPSKMVDFQGDTKPDRIACLNFARDIAEGFLDELSDFIDAKIRREKKAIDDLEVGMDKLQAKK